MELTNLKHSQMRSHISNLKMYISPSHKLPNRIPQGRRSSKALKQAQQILGSSTRVRSVSPLQKRSKVKQRLKKQHISCNIQWTHFCPGSWYSNSSWLIQNLSFGEFASFANLGIRYALLHTTKAARSEMVLS